MPQFFQLLDQIYGHSFNATSIWTKVRICKKKNNSIQESIKSLKKANEKLNEISRLDIDAEVFEK